MKRTYSDYEMFKARTRRQNRVRADRRSPDRKRYNEKHYLIDDDLTPEEIHAGYLRYNRVRQRVGYMPDARRNSYLKSDPMRALLTASDRIEYLMGNVRDERLEVLQPAWALFKDVLKDAIETGQDG